MMSLVKSPQRGKSTELDTNDNHENGMQHKTLRYMNIYGTTRKFYWGPLNGCIICQETDKAADNMADVIECFMRK